MTETGDMNKPQGRMRTSRGRFQRGQSLVETALSITVLVLVFSGAVELGRMFFTSISLDSALSEGAHWAAAYPGCLLYGSAVNAVSIIGMPKYCDGTNSVIDRIKNESAQLKSTNL